MRRRLAALRLADVESYVRLLDDAHAGPAEWRQLEGAITVGETYFLRYVEQFAALRETILPELIARNSQSKRLRIWSAGCATGAEPYSVAILVAELLGDRIADWRITILGTDINEAALEAARAASFGAWALRSLSAEQRSAWFTPEDRSWRLRPRFRSLVRFQHGNLLDLLGPNAPLDLTDFDLILCRNVLIYFHPDTMNAVVAALADRLEPDGWLLVGHAEPNPGFEAHVQTVSLPGATAYRRRSSDVPVPVPPPASEARTPEIWAPVAFDQPVLAPAPAPRRPPVIQAPPAPPPAPAPTPAHTGIPEIRALADLGRFAEAAEACAVALQSDPSNPATHFYLGLVAQAQGHLDQAEDALRRAVYLDGGFLMAQYHLGLVRLERGAAAEGRRTLAAAARMAASLSPTTGLCEGEGLTAADLRELARLQLESGSGARD
ncbi:protein-glutamate O-methyltransferase CheR [Phenylobacterium sp.]|uniref:CheR family methyltransferase n=1 Tax=Phenylobacterium sp. TaxID=1871053 RepID=UPI00272FBE99|nr:CheR family methyltransferase [Phenylobacterium sp.]MDP1619107.1 CheR family methyltransferase [Phenylobacterium sp.]MDP1987940.1 CheR family methyltransferase [Phenylobacterium sp.]